MAVLVEPLQKMCRDNLFRPALQHLSTAAAGERFQRPVPAHDLPFNIFDDHSHINGFDNIFAEVFQALVFRCLLFEGPVETRVFQRDADVIGNRLEKLQVLACQIIAVMRAPQPDIGNHSIFGATRYEVVQIVDVRLEKIYRRAGTGGKKGKFVPFGIVNPDVFAGTNREGSNGSSRKIAERSTNNARPRRSMIRSSMLSKSISDPSVLPKSIRVCRRS